VVDAFTLNWNKFFFYAFPPFILVIKVLQKIRAEKAKGIVMVPFSITVVSLIPLNLESLIFESNRDTLFSLDREPHPLWRKLTLVVGKYDSTWDRFRILQKITE